MGDISGSKASPQPPAGLGPSGYDPGRDSDASALAQMEQAFDELRGCVIRRPGETCEVRKEFLVVALDILDSAIREMKGMPQ
jgi:hypothetical protein